MSTSVLLVGAGGHARVVVDMLSGLGWRVGAYADPRAADWVDAPRIEEDTLGDGDPYSNQFVLGFAGVRPGELRRRLARFHELRALGLDSPALVDGRALVSPGAAIGAGAQIMPGAIVNASARIDEAAIVNTGAIVEHEAVIGPGAHLAPGSIVLGAVEVGSCAMVGAGAVLLPGGRVEEGSTVRAGERHPGEPR